MRIHSIGLLALLGGVAFGLTGCGKYVNLDDRTTASVPYDHRERHPYIITDQTRVLDVPVGQGDAQLPEGTRETVLGFLARYRAESEGVIQIARPQGSGNAGTAANAASEVAELLSLAGVPASRIVRSTYGASSDSIAPVKLVYTAVRATVGQCGQWPRDLNDGPANHDNRNYFNFGCSVRNNIAAQISNPTDLLGPREMTPGDARRRDTVIEGYRSGGNPTASTAQ